MDFRKIIKEYAEAPISRHLILELLNDYQSQNDRIIALLDTKIKSVSFSRIKEDVVRFIQNDDVLKIWSPEYFKDLVEKIKFENT